MNLWLVRDSAPPARRDEPSPTLIAAGIYKRGAGQWIASSEPFPCPLLHAPSPDVPQVSPDAQRGSMLVCHPPSLVGTIP